MTSDAEMGGWTDLLHSSSKLLEQAAPSAQVPPLQVRTLPFGSRENSNKPKKTNSESLAVLILFLFSKKDVLNSLVQGTG